MGAFLIPKITLVQFYFQNTKLKAKMEPVKFEFIIKHPDDIHQILDNLETIYDNVGEHAVDDGTPVYGNKWLLGARCLNGIKGRFKQIFPPSK